MGKQVKIKFITEGTSPAVGNIYVGKISTLDIDQAKKFVNSGAAKYYKADAKPAEVVEKSLNDYSVAELKETADNLKIEYTSRTVKADLIEAIEKKLKETDNQGE